MKIIISIISIFTLLSSISFSQNQECLDKEKFYLNKAGQCFNNIFESKGVDKVKFKKSFEQYFIDSKLVEENLEKGELYLQILKALEENPNSMPLVKEANYVAITAGKLNITIPELEQYKHLDCIKEEYFKYKIYCPNDTISGLYLIGDISATLQEIPNIHYQLVSSTIRMFSTAKSFESECLQDAVVMLFWFQTAGLYGDW
tara:strand:+ start:1690 stop:2295 length:606 start_codon:yes stop_codon:yes gene_type:complete